MTSVTLSIFNFIISSFPRSGNFSLNFFSNNRTPRYITTDKGRRGIRYRVLMEDFGLEEHIRL